MLPWAAFLLSPHPLGIFCCSLYHSPVSWPQMWFFLAAQWSVDVSRIQHMWSSLRPCLLLHLVGSFHDPNGCLSTESWCQQPRDYKWGKISFCLTHLVHASGPLTDPSHQSCIRSLARSSHRLVWKFPLLTFYRVIKIWKFLRQKSFVLFRFYHDYICHAS